MPFRDLREFIDRLEVEGELSRVKAQVDWNLEIGAISRRTIEMRGPALLFENIKDYGEQYRILANPLAGTKPVVHGRLALAMGLPKDTPSLKLIDIFAERSQNLVKPVRVDWGPCKEEIHHGDDVDLWEFPVPFIHGPDGGRYMGTWHIDVVKDPDTGWVNWGMYRHMLHDSKALGWASTPYQHGPGIFARKYEARGQAMPMAIAIGTEPISSVVAASAVPAGVFEAEVAGSLRGEPVELVKCETNDLEVPATAEIVLEGVVMPGERRMEGSFGEYTGYDAGGRRPQIVFHVECVTHRKNPILPMTNPGKPWEEDAVIFSITDSALLANELRKREVPFKSVYVVPPALAVVVSTKPQYAGFVHTLASAVWASKPGVNRPFLFVVGEDVDVTNMEEVMWCVTTRVHPATDIHILRNTPCSTLTPFLSDEDRSFGRGARVIFDANFPYEWPADRRPTIIDFEHAWPAEIKERVLSRWQEYGIG
ncbi:MAG: UbiD family decarboxylase [Dehalococcoidia bacterium]|nr:UbiD family decarboxylase [Dehalococcoidia bacterium]